MYTAEQNINDIVTPAFVEAFAKRHRASVERLADGCALRVSDGTGRRIAITYTPGAFITWAVEVETRRDFASLYPLGAAALGIPMHYIYDTAAEEMAALAAALDRALGFGGALEAWGQAAADYLDADI